jgi:hypothetical protein
MHMKIAGKSTVVFKHTHENHQIILFTVVIKQVGDLVHIINIMILLCSSQLEGSLGIQVEGESRQELSIDRNSDPLLETKLKEAANKELKELNEEKRKSARRKE